MGIIWENATASTTSAENAVEAAMKAAGFKIVYDHGVGPFDTNFLPDIISMKTKGVKMFFSTGAARQLRRHPGQADPAAELQGHEHRGRRLLEPAAEAGRQRPPTTCTSSRATPCTSGQDAKTVAGRGAVRQVDEEGRSSNPNFEIESVYGWASAELFAQALQARREPTHPGRA